jgi:glycosyltransferase involved in cell wall biosynthesis
MRIGMITGEFPPMQGGVGDFTLELARELIHIGHEVYVLTNHQARPELQLDGLTVQATVEQWGRWGRTSNSSPRGLQQAIQWVKHYHPAVVNIQYQAAAYNMHVAANHLPNRLRTMTTVVTTFHDLLVPYLFPKAGKRRKRIVYQMAQDSHGVIVTNRQDEEELYPVRPMPPVVRIPIGSNIAVNPPLDYDPEAWREKHGIPSQAFLVGFFGFINKSKGVNTLAQAIRLLEERFDTSAHLLFVGGLTGSSDESNIHQADIAQQLIGGLGITRRVHWTGFVEAEQVSAYLMACDVVALPFQDGVSFRRGTLMAALAHGCPIVTTHPSQPDPDLIDGYAMRMVPPDNPARLAEILHELWLDAPQRQTLGANARALARQFSWDTIGQQTLAFFKEIRIR